MDPYSQSSSFLDLLSNQQPNTQHPNQMSDVFGPQWPEDETVDAHTVEDCKERQKWSPTEDVVLISAWLNTSKDHVVGNEQKTIAFWKRIAAYFAASPKLAGFQKRKSSCYDAAMKEKSSGHNENDVMKMAHEFFFNDYKVKFTLEHAWLELRHDQKWCGASSTQDKVKSSKRRKLDDQTAQSSTLWQEKLNKQKLLDSLIAKTKSLSELEIALKNKLINDMLTS
ncbi:hypothetical protein N665_0435s0006 [Sinapis alba]|nr:hypothetical protein N665_0435s0006 [Sinapis alba]